jgi:hypothetical protein
LDELRLSNVFHFITSSQIIGKISVVVGLVNELDESVFKENPAVTVFSDGNIDDSSGSLDVDLDKVSSGWLSVRNTVSVEHSTSSGQEDHLAILSTGHNGWDFRSSHH